MQAGDLDAEFAQALRAGITSCVVLPGDGAVFGGRGALVKTQGGKAEGAPAVAKLCLAGDALRDDRAPTSAVMAYSDLRQRLEAGHSEGDDAFSAFARGDLPGLCTVDDPGNARRMLDLAQALGLRLILHLDPRPEPGFSELALSGRPVLCGPYDLDTPRLSLALPAQLAERLINLIRVATQWLPGGLAVATILSCAVFAAISGSSPVTMLAVGASGSTSSSYPHSQR